MKKITLFFLLFFLVKTNAQIGINTTLPEAQLDIRASNPVSPTFNDGFLAPRVSAFPAAPTAAQTGMLIYLTTTVGINTPGFYYWTGSQWLPLIGDGWRLFGNSGITSPLIPGTYGTSTIGATENFLGTRDANDIVFGTNTIERMRIERNTGEVGIGIAYPSFRLHVNEERAGYTAILGQNTYTGNSNAVGVRGISNNNPGYGYGGSFEGGFVGGFFNNNATAYTGAGYGVYAISTGTAGTRYGGYFNASGATTRNYGGYFSATGATNNHGLVVVNGNVGIGNAFPDRAQLQVQGAIGNTVATFNSGLNSLGMAMVSDWPGIYFNCYYNGGTRQMSNNSYPGIINYNPGGQFEFALNNTANTVAGNLAGGTFSNRFVVHRDNGAYFSYNNPSIPALSAYGGGVVPDVGWASNGSWSIVPELGVGVNAGGQFTGVEGRANYLSTATYDKMGGLFYVSGYNGTASWSVPAIAAVGSMVDNVVYKIVGFGAVSTIVKDTQEKDRIMVAPESPEALFQDYGIGTLTNGYAKITIDPILSKNIRVDETHPLKVFIQLEGDCNGVYVFNKTSHSFEVKELQNGNSNVSFSYQIVGFRADEERGGNISKYSDMRFKPFKVQFKEVINNTEENNFEQNMSSHKNEEIKTPEIKDLPVLK